MARTGVAASGSVFVSVPKDAIIEIAGFFEIVLPKIKNGCSVDKIQSEDEIGGPIRFSGCRMIARIMDRTLTIGSAATRRLVGKSPCHAT